MSKWMDPGLKAKPTMSPKAREARNAILRVVGKRAQTGGLVAFYTPQEWKKRGEKYGTESILVISHDGGDLAPYFNWDYCAYEAVEKMRVELEKVGLYAEQCTSWYSAIYARGEATLPAPTEVADAA